MREEYRFKCRQLTTSLLPTTQAKQQGIMKNNKRQSDIKTTTLNALVAVSKTETGMDYVQVMPTNPRAGLVEPFRGRGYGQLLSNGTFDFVRKKRIRRKPVLKLPHSSVSYGEDGYDRFTFTLPAGQREEFCRLLRNEATLAGLYVADDLECE